MEFISEEEDSAPQITRWQENVKQYLDNHNLGETSMDSFYLADSKEGEQPNPENTGLILVRSLLSDLENKISDEHKYIMTQTFYNYGDFSTIDLVKLPENYHREILKSYMNNILTPDLSQDIFPASKEGYSRYLIGGGHVSRDENTITFENTSGDFGNLASAYNINNIAAYLANKSKLELEATSENPQQGEEYIQNVLDIMKHHKKSDEFYSKLVDFYFVDAMAEGGVQGTTTHALTMMKAIDRAQYEQTDFFQTLTEEMSTGIGREFLLKATAYHLKNKDK
ncbi:MAG: hypothetical protein ACQESE_02495 [Nanobdellota archaeon]